MSHTNKVSVVVTGTDWLGAGIGSIESAFDRIFMEANDEVILSVYAISNGTDVIFEWICQALNRGVLVKMLLNGGIEHPPSVMDRLLSLQNTFPHFQLFTFIPNTDTDHHAKVVLADHKIALVGSSNLSRRGLIGNHEMALLVEGPAAQSVASALARLFASPHTRRIIIHS